MKKCLVSLHPGHFTDFTGGSAKTVEKQNKLIS